MSQDAPTKMVSKVLDTKYPLIDSDPHFTRVIRYARGSDYVHGAVAAAFAPAALLFLERVSPSYAGRGALAPAMRLAGAVGLAGGFLYFYQRSALRFYGATENQREIDLDMRELTDRVKAGLTPYGTSTLNAHLQGVAARQSRYSALMLSTVPWFNFVNHDQHGVDTAKYYRQAEKELAEEEQRRQAQA